jgi:hypothetical protein
MNKTITSAVAASLVAAPLLAATLFGAPLAALAKGNNAACDSTGDKTTLQGIIVRGDCRITQRESDIADAVARVAQMKKVSDTVKGQLTTTLNNTKTTLDGIKAKLDADTDIDTAKTDYRSIFTTVRVYQLVLPQTWLVAASDRSMTITAKLQTLHDDLQAKVSTTATSSSASAQALLDHMQSMINDANAKVAMVMDTSTGVLTLTPDNGDKTKQASNKSAIQGFRADIQTVKSDIDSAVGDAKSVRNLLK